MSKPKLITVIGTTASGKSSLGIELAKHYGAEIVSADSSSLRARVRALVSAGTNGTRNTWCQLNGADAR